jgi:hypothetical protein
VLTRSWAAYSPASPGEWDIFAGVKAKQLDRMFAMTRKDQIAGVKRPDSTRHLFSTSSPEKPKQPASARIKDHAA